MAKHKDFSTMSNDELQSFCRALDQVARRAEEKMRAKRRRSARTSTEQQS